MTPPMHYAARRHELHYHCHYVITDDARAAYCYAINRAIYLRHAAIHTLLR